MRALVLAVLCLLAMSAGPLDSCTRSSLPDDCDVTTEIDGVKCTLEDNGRYGCECEDTEIEFASDDFCALEPEEQDEVAEEECDFGFNNDGDDGEGEGE